MQVTSIVVVQQKIQNDITSIPVVIFIVIKKLFVKQFNAILRVY